MDGYELARKLRRSPHSALVPIVFLTAKDESEDRIEGFESGVDVYLTKPFEPDELIAVIKNILQRVERTHSVIARLVGKEETIEETNFVRDEALTEAEWRVAEAVARGLSNKEIAAEINLSIRTIENHISRILIEKEFFQPRRNCPLGAEKNVKNSKLFLPRKPVKKLAAGERNAFR